jgi:hypothetical protein
VNAHHDRNAHQITGHAPFHQSKNYQEESMVQLQQTGNFFVLETYFKP